MGVEIKESPKKCSCILLLIENLSCAPLLIHIFPYFCVINESLKHETIFNSITHTSGAHVHKMCACGNFVCRERELLREAYTSRGEDVFLPRWADCCGRMVLTLQSPGQGSKVCQPVQLITPPLSHKDCLQGTQSAWWVCDEWPHWNCEKGLDRFSPLQSLNLCLVI